MITDMSVCATRAAAASQAGTVPVAQIPLVSGAELYAEPSVTGLNTQPVDDHCALALLGAQLSGAGLQTRAGRSEDQPHFPLDLAALCTRLLSEGSVALVRSDLLSGGADTPVCHPDKRQTGVSAPPGNCFVLLDGLLTLDPAVPFTATHFAQRFWAKVDGESKCVTRVFSRRSSVASKSARPGELSSPTGQDQAKRRDGGRDAAATEPELGATEWHVRDYTDFATDDQRVIATATAPGDAIVAYPNGLGILYPAQRAYRRLEGIFATIERMQSGVNSKTIISGYVGSVEQAHSELRRADRDVALFPTGATVHRVASTSAIDQLMREFETLLPLYLRRLHFVHFADGDQLSGVSRRLAMAPLLAFVETTRRRLAEVVAQCGGRLEFDPEPWERVVGRKAE